MSPQGFPASRSQRLLPTEAIRFEYRLMQIDNILIFPVSLTVIIVPGVVFTQKQTALLQGTSKATGSGTVHAENTNNAVWSDLIHHPPEYCYLFRRSS